MQIAQTPLGPLTAVARKDTLEMDDRVQVSYNAIFRYIIVKMQDRSLKDAVIRSNISCTAHNAVMTRALKDSLHEEYVTCQSK